MRKFNDLWIPRRINFGEKECGKKRKWC